MAQKYSRPGPWDDEPDELTWTDERTGYQCRLIRVSGSGHLCGYVQVPEGHPLHGVDYSADIPESMKPLLDAVMEGTAGKRGAIDIVCVAMGGDARVGFLFDVHGGVTYSGELREQEGHWFGFDCAHCDDMSPGYRIATHGEYRDVPYVQAECASLAKQLKQVAG